MCVVQASIGSGFLFEEAPEVAVVDGEINHEQEKGLQSIGGVDSFIPALKEKDVVTRFGNRPTMLNVASSKSRPVARRP